MPLVEAGGAAAATLIRPESDWFHQNRDFVKGFEILERFVSHGHMMDIRGYDWVRPSAGQLRLQRRYLGISFDGSMRRSVLRSDRWTEPQYSGACSICRPT